MIGRDCKRMSLSSAHAHSISCGTLKKSSSFNPRSNKLLRTCSSRLVFSCLSCSMSVKLFSPFIRKYPFFFFLMVLSATAPSLFKTNISGVTIPDAIASPSPHVDSITISSPPSTGLAVNITPLTSASTIF